MRLILENMAPPQIAQDAASRDWRNGWYNAAGAAGRAAAVYGANRAPQSPRRRRVLRRSAAAALPLEVQPKVSDFTERIVNGGVDD